MQIATEITDAYRTWLRMLINVENTDFESTGSIFRIVYVADESENGTTYGLWDEVMFLDGTKAGRADALQQFVKKARRKGLQVVAVTSESNVWIGDRPAPGEPENRESGRAVFVVDVDGMLIDAGFSEKDPELHIGEPRQLSEVDEVGILPAQMLAAVRGVKAPRCYLCARQHDIRPYGPRLVSNPTRYSGFWVCNSDTEWGNPECGVRADRKFSKAQQDRALRDASQGMLNVFPNDATDARAYAAEALNSMSRWDDPVR